MSAGKFFGGIPILLGLFSRIPVPASLFPEEPVPGSRALAWLPLVAAFLGALTGSAALGLRQVLPAVPAAWCAAAFHVLLGWGLHLDGWTDCWDGFGSGRRGEELRTVMKDSRVGGFGAAGMVLALGCWASLVGTLPTDRLVVGCALAAGVGRLAIPAAARIGRYPWPSGMGLDFVRPFSNVHLGAALLCAASLTPLDPVLVGTGTAAALATGFLMGLGANRRLGGVNGDVLGASAVAGELILLAMAASGL
jgi:adenosylcobinamide-GDP ribazoletransferase